MAILLTPTHLDTIVQLIELARKRKCQIFISTGKRHYPYKDEAAQAVYEYCVDHKGLPEDLKKEFEGKIDVDEASFLHEWISFELVERDPDGFLKSHHLTYSSYEMGLFGKADKDPYADGLSPEAEDWLSDHCPSCDSCFSGLEILFDETDDAVHGFGGSTPRSTSTARGWPSSSSGTSCATICASPVSRRYTEVSHERKVALIIGFGIATLFSPTFWTIAGLYPEGDPFFRVMPVFVLPLICYAVFPLALYAFTIV